MRVCARMAVVLLIANMALAEARAAEELKSEIKKVTVYADRAQVTRVAKVKVSTDPVEVAFRKLPGWVDDASVRLAILPSSAGQIIDVRVQRDFLAQSTDEVYQKALDDVQEIADQIAALDDELAILQAEAAQIAQIKVFSMDRISKDAVLREIKVDSYGKVVKFVAESLRDIAARRRAITSQRRALAPELMVRQKRLNELQALTQLEETSVYVSLDGHRSKSATLELTYMLPGATWEPVHELRTKGADPKSAAIRSLAVVSQTSGEDWDGVDISFATQSSTESNRIPQLRALKLGDSGAAARIVQERNESFARAQAAFEGQNMLWNERNVHFGKGENADAYQANFAQMVTVQSKAAAVFQKLRQRGTTAQFQGKGRAKVRGDGRPVRIPIGEVQLEAQQAIVAVPEQSLNAVRTLQMTNTGTQPILPGEVSLFRDGAFLGMTDFAFVAEGEEFAVFLGVADRIKLSRVLDRKKSSIKRKKRTQMKVSFLVSVENLSDEEAIVDLADRVPVSENKEIEVEDIEITGDKKPDSKGLLRWKLTLKPREKKTFRIAYEVEYPPQLVREMNRKRRARQQAMPSASYDFEEPDVSEQIMNLEKSF
jgi:uncharacterized protein (TIGR02231 family)